MQVLRLPLFQLPQLITQLVNAQVSIKRIEEFLAASRSDPLPQLAAAPAGDSALPTLDQGYLQSHHMPQAVNASSILEVVHLPCSTAYR